MNDDAFVGVIFGVKDQGPQRRVLIALRAGQVLDDLLQHITMLMLFLAEISGA
jgi:hypothetical protein